MSTNGKKAVAPCGHPGEHVIGAYVRCLQGCTKDPHVAPQPSQARRRGVKGHVDMCACPHCTIRRRGRKIILRTADGKQVESDWDGVNDHLRFRSNVNGSLRHWKVLDEDGDVLIDGMCDVETTTGMDITIDWLMPTTTLTVRTNNPMYNPGVWNHDDLGIYEPYANYIRELQDKLAALTFPIMVVLE